MHSFSTPQFQRRAVVAKGAGVKVWTRVVGARPTHSSMHSSQAASRVESVVRFKNSAANGLGVDMPAGLVHVFRRDKDGFGLERIASLRCPHVGADEIATIPVELLANVRAKRTQTGASLFVDCVLVSNAGLC